MKFSFSTKGWNDRSLQELEETAVSLGFTGIELHNVHNDIFTKKDGAFSGSRSRETVRELYRKHLSIPCIDACEDIGNPAQAENAKAEIAQFFQDSDIAG